MASVLWSVLKGKQLSGAMECAGLESHSGSWEDVTHAEKRWKEAKSKKPDLWGRKDLGLKRTEHFVSHKGTELDGKQAASKSTVGS